MGDEKSQKPQVQEVITKEFLENLKYGKEMQAKLEELGVKDAWEAGKKKKDIVEKALGMLKTLNELKEKDSKKVEEMPEDELQKEMLLKEAEKEAALEQQILEEDAKAAGETKEFVEKKELTKEDIEKNIIIVNANIKNGLPTQREILLKKLKHLEDLLEKYEE